MYQAIVPLKTFNWLDAENFLISRQDDNVDIV